MEEGTQLPQRYKELWPHQAGTDSPGPGEYRAPSLQTDKGHGFAGAARYGSSANELWDFQDGGVTTGAREGPGPATYDQSVPKGREVRTGPSPDSYVQLEGPPAGSSHRFDGGDNFIFSVAGEPFQYTVLESERRSISEDLKADVLAGICGTVKQKYIHAKYLYDDAGSQIYEEIEKLQEYYPIRCETEILRCCKEDLVKTCFVGSEDVKLIELGAGDGLKTRILLDALNTAGVNYEYIPIDISEQAVSGLMSKLKELGPKLRTHGIVAEYQAALEYLQRLFEPSVKKVIMFLGSSIGNFSGEDIVPFLRSVHNTLRTGDQFLIGFDLKKDIRTLQAAYDDPHGVTARFNYNLLVRMNRELGANFDVAQWYHHACYNARTGAMDSFLISTAEQTVTFHALDKSVTFDAFESIWTEESVKYSPKDIESLAASSGFSVKEMFYDSSRYFVDAIWQK